MSAITHFNLDKAYVYDIESYPNIFTLAIMNALTMEYKIFEISDRYDQRQEMFAYLRNLSVNKDYMVGFNNFGFDYPVLHYILKNKQCTPLDIFRKVEQLIGTDFNVRWKNHVKIEEQLIPQIDLYLINHFDNMAKATSLKALEIFMRMDDVQELPFEVGSILDDEQKDILKKYNLHDIRATWMFLMKNIEAINFRFSLNDPKKINANDVKLGGYKFEEALEAAQKGICYDYSSGYRKVRQTKRDSIAISECIFDYINFNRKEFKAVKDWMAGRVITETKGVFSDILESDLGEVAKYAELKTKRQLLKYIPTEAKIATLKEKHHAGWLTEELLKSGKKSYYWNWRVAESLNVVIDGLVYVFGTGGIHASLEKQVVEAEDGYVIKDKDAASFYPNLCIQNRIYPEHLSELFCDVYEDLFDERRTYDKKNPLNLLLKLALNGTYGKSNDKYSPFYDPKFTMSITVNGQLSLCMLAEKLLDVPTLQMLMLNTDGLTYKVSREYEQQADDICKQWELLTKLELESVNYKKMLIRDVNNYIAVYENGKAKCKGAYEWEGLAPHKNPSFLVIPMAVQKAFVEGVDIAEFIRGHNDKFDFMGRAKVPRTSRLVTRNKFEIDTRQQNICRYYLSCSGDEMFKIMPPTKPESTVRGYRCGDDVVNLTTATDIAKYERRGYSYIGDALVRNPERVFAIHANKKVKICNNIVDFNWDVDYDYYINEANKLLNFEIVIDSDNEEDQ